MIEHEIVWEMICAPPANYQNLERCIDGSLQFSPVIIEHVTVMCHIYNRKLSSLIVV